MNLKKPHILVVDDELDIRELVADILGDYNYAVTTAHDASAARSAVRLEKFDAILLDIWLPGTDGITLLKEWTSNSEFKTPVVMMSAHGTVQTAVEATQLGAYDYLEKPVSAGRLEITLRNAVNSISPTPTVGESVTKTSPEISIVGTSEEIDTLRRQIEAVALEASNLLIVGESGTGKRTLARMIHNASKAVEAPFVLVDWLVSDLDDRAVSELLAEASGGTLLIPDIHLYDGHHQNKFLGMLNSHSISTDVDTQAGTRLIATASDRIESAVKSGEFRSEILHRIGELRVEVPPLREFREDMPALVGYFTDMLNNKEDLRYKKFTTAAINKLRNHSWGGNLAELINVLRQALIAGENDTIDAIDIEPWLLEGANDVDSQTPKDEENYYYLLPFREARNQFERAYLLRNLKRTKSYAEMAKLTGLHRTSLFRKLKEHGIDVTPGLEASEEKENGEA